MESEGKSDGGGEGDNGDSLVSLRGGQRSTNNSNKAGADRNSLYLEEDWKKMSDLMAELGGFSLEEADDLAESDSEATDEPEPVETKLEVGKISKEKASFPVVMWDFDQDQGQGEGDPEVAGSTGKQLAREGLVTVLGPSADTEKFPGIILDPLATQVLSPADATLLKQGGLAVIDCSWAQIVEISGKLFPKDKLPLIALNRRKLPFLVCANTANFGEPKKLSCAEAIAASMIICGYPELGDSYLQFKWGKKFLQMNRQYLEGYSKSASAEEVVAFQTQTLEREAQN